MYQNLTERDKQLFLIGVEYGRREQLKEDFPDVGFRFNRSNENLWDSFVEANELNK